MASILLGLLVALLVSSAHPQRLIWPADVKPLIKDHSAVESASLAFNNEAEEAFHHCYNLNHNFHEPEDHDTWIIVPLSNATRVSEIAARLATLRKQDRYLRDTRGNLSVTIEARVSNASSLNVTVVKHIGHVMTDFSDWHLFTRCGEPLTFQVGNDGEEIINLTFECDPLVFATHVSLHIRGVTSTGDVSLCELSVTEPCLSHCREDAHCPGTRCCQGDECKALLQKLTKTTDRGQLSDGLYDFLDEQRPKEQLTVDEVELLVPLMEEIAFSDDDKASSESSLNLIVSLSNLILSSSAVTSSLLLRTAAVVEEAGALPASLRNTSSSLSMCRGAVRVQVLPPGRILYHSSLLSNSSVSLSLSSPSDTAVSVSVVSLPSFLPSLASDVVSVSSTSDLLHVDLHLYRRRDGHVRCGFWSPSESRWSTSGCRLLDSNSTHGVCRCSHLTSFALLLSVDGWTAGNGHRTALRWLSLVASSVSCLLLGYAAACFLVLLQKHAWYFVDLHLTMSLLLSQLLLGVSAVLMPFPVACAVTAALLHLTLLCVFAWALNQGVRMYLKLVRVLPTLLSHRRAMLGVGYGLPLLLMAASLPITYPDYRNREACWMRPRSPALWLFVGPAAGVLTANAGILLLALVRVRCAPGQRLRSSGRRKRLFGVSKLLFLMALLGLNWLLGFLVNVPPPGLALAFSYLFIAANLATSLLLCLGYRLFSLDVRLALLQALHRRRLLYGPLKAYAKEHGLGRNPKSSQSGQVTVNSASGRQRLSRSSESKTETRV